MSLKGLLKIFKMATVQILFLNVWILLLRATTANITYIIITLFCLSMKLNFAQVVCIQQNLLLAGIALNCTQNT
jgi:hypothetical protein